MLIVIYSNRVRSVQPPTQLLPSEGGDANVGLFYLTVHPRYCTVKSMSKGSKYDTAVLTLWQLVLA